MTHDAAAPRLGRAPQPAVDSAARGTAPRVVLVVDDDPVCRDLVEVYLDACGLTNPRICLSSGTDVVDDLQRRAALGPDHLPALLLLDEQMPGLSGLEVLRWIHESSLDVPVILLTGHDSAGDVKKAYDLGARSYLVKPVGFDALGAVIRDLQLPWRLV